MSFDVKSPTALGEAIDAMVVCTKKNTHKDSEKQQDTQKTAQEFLLDYLSDTAGMCIEGKGKEDERVNAKTAAEFSMLIERYLTGVDGDKIPHYIYADSLFSCRVYNGRFFERMDLSAFSFLIKRFLVESQVGVVYQQHCPKKIAEEVLATLWHTGQRWQPDSRYFVFYNGVLDIENMSLVPFSLAYQTNNIFDFDFTENANCPMFEKALNDALDTDTANVLQELFGYQLFSDARHEKIGVLVGCGRNGKSVILKAVAHALGKERVTNYSLPQITEKSGIHISAMVGKMANICFDSGSVIKVGDEAIFKQYVSGEPILCKQLYQQPYLTTDYPQSVIAVNTLPQSSDMSDGWFRRMLIIEFPRQIPIEQVDTQLFEKLKEERMGILLWVLEGMRRLIHQEHFSTSKAIEDVATQYRKDIDSVALWLDERRYFPSNKESVTLATLFENYDKWRETNRFSSMRQTTFRKRLEALKYRVYKSGTTVVGIEQKIDETLPF